ncbi:chromosome segregation protein SMC [Chloracidobacterium validum]|uniref:Chromosome partition protein Smc n=1 Tax=Chloracidobacterium validum TaxID=2821543 RepID=A0ABX8B7V3_9BACT|nr:chromosome segregation protein SMC [Chloracidobacterium validum]QUW02746.1 chromosome segregation protein SMC [Chloracidobacterium validum]
MLRLDKLELRGFKSFCDTTQVIFHTGVTAIVGPNGCGKSNIVDAMTWVLGEQSAKNLRGGKMEDVIFNGTRDRKPLGLAEVSLTFTVVQDIVEGRAAEPNAETDDPTAALVAANEAAEAADALTDMPPTTDAATAVPQARRRPPRLPRLVAGEKITIGRRLYRSGDSDYLINGRICRLRDIQDFFSGTGLGRAHYAIIEQGRISQVLSSKPQDRRAIIEEAAGIGRFKAKRHEAELKLEATRHNLARLDDLIGEIERSIGNLRRQAQKSRKFIALREELRASQRRYVALVHGRLQASQATVAETRANLIGERDRCQAELDRLSAQVTAAREAARQAETELAEAHQAAAAAERALDQAQHVKANLEAERVRLATRDTELAAALEQCAQRQQHLVEARAQAQASADGLAAALTALEAELSAADTAHQAAAAALRDAETAHDQARQQHLDWLTRAERLRHQSEQLADAAARLARQRQSLEHEHLRATERLAQATTECAAATDRLTAIEQQLVAVKSDLAAAQTALTEAQAARQTLAGQVAEAQRTRQRAEDRRQSLEDLDRQHAHYAATVRTLLDRAKDIPGFQPLGTLADALAVAEGYETLVEQVLGEALQAVIVPTVAAARAAADWLATARVGRATLLVTGIHGGADGTGGVAPKPESPATRLWDVLGLPEHLAPTFRQAFPHLADARLVSSLDAALEASAAAPAVCFITPAGDQVLGGVCLTAGSGESKRILQVKRDIRALRAEAQALDKRIGTLTKELARLDARQAAAQAQRDALDAELRQLETTSAAQAVEVAQRRRDAERATQHLAVIAAEQRQLTVEVEQLAPRRAAVETELAEAIARRDAAEQATLAAQQRLARLRPEVENAARQVAELRARAASTLERHRAAEAELRRLEREWRELEQTRARLTLERADLQTRNADWEQAYADSQTREAEAADAITRMRGRVAEAETRLADCRQTLDDLDRAQQAAQAVERDLRDRLAAAEVEAARLAAEVDYLSRYCQTELGCPVEMLPPPAADGPPEDTLAETIATLKEAIAGLGSINMLALEELSEAESRHEFLTAQRADVLDSLAAAEETLREIRQRTKRRFREAFDRINAYFGEVFQELFGGGRGEMLLIEPDDPLESGIDIVAQPPGKRLQSVLLLSGGEKAMAAMALILAIFRYRPSPFCVLDEVDAPLDEANIDRFTEKIRAMSAQTQFLIVTHNKRTMEAADSIYGVTMPEPGVSKLLSVRFDDKPSAAPTATASADAVPEADDSASNLLGVVG